MKINSGCIFVARKIQDSEIAHKPPHFREIWNWLLMQANHKENNGIKRGQCVRSYKDIREGLKWFVGYRKMTYSKDQCESATKFLRSRGMITTMKTTRGLLITIINYDTYQDLKNYENHTRTTTRATMKPHYKQECNNVKNEIKKKPLVQKTKSFSHEVTNICNYFVSTLDNKKIVPDTTIGKSKWLDAINKCNTLEGYSFDQIKDIIKQFRNDPFWRTNFMTPLKLRQRNKEGVKYIDVFYSKMQINDTDTGDENIYDENYKTLIDQGYSSEKAKELLKNSPGRRGAI